MHDMLYDAKWVTCYMTQMPAIIHDKKRVMFCMTHDVWQFYMPQNGWCITWCKMYDILHDTKCVTCYMRQNVWHATGGKIDDILNELKCMTCYMMQNMLHGENAWHVTWHRMSDLLYMKQNVWYVTWHKMHDMLHDTKCVTYYMRENVWCATRH